MTEGFQVRQDDGGIVFDVLGQPRSSPARLGPVHGDRLEVAVTAPRVDGVAETTVIELVARALGIGRGGLEVVAGMSSRRKLRVRGIDRGRLEQAVRP